MEELSFRPLARSDLPLLVRWLAAPHVARWWTEGGDLEAVTARYQPKIEGRVPTEVFVIELDGEPTGIIQRYRLADHPDYERAIRIPAHVPHFSGVICAPTVRRCR